MELTLAILLSFMRKELITYFMEDVVEPQSIKPQSVFSSEFMYLVGVASGVDGINFERLNNGNPIVTPAGYQAVNKYGAGQPSVIYLQGTIQSAMKFQRKILHGVHRYIWLCFSS